MFGFPSLGSLGLVGILLLVVCVVHAIRSNRIFPWIYVVVFLPGIGPLIYIGMVIVPELVRGRTARRFSSSVRKMADPYGGLRKAHREVGLVGSVDSKRALAEEHFAHGHYAEAAAIYRDAMQGVFSEDTALLYGLARAQFKTGDAAGAQASLEAIKRVDPNHASEDADLLSARALEALGRDDEALAQYKRLVRYYAGEEARARYGLLLKKLGHIDEANQVFKEILRLLDGAPSRYRRAQAQWGDIARQNITG
jgi:hypothetical protein